MGKEKIKKKKKKKDKKKNILLKVRSTILHAPELKLH